MNQYTTQDFERDFPDDDTTRLKWREKNLWPDSIFCSGYAPLALNEVDREMKWSLLWLETSASIG